MLMMLVVVVVMMLVVVVVVVVVVVALCERWIFNKTLKQNSCYVDRFCVEMFACRHHKNLRPYICCALQQRTCGEFYCLCSPNRF